MSGARWIGSTGIAYAIFQNKFVKDDCGNEVSYKNEFIPSGTDYGKIEMKGDPKQCALMILKEAVNKPTYWATGPTAGSCINTWGPFKFENSEVKLQPYFHDADENTQKLLQEFKTLYKMKAFW